MDELIVIGSGSGEADNITLKALDALEKADHVMVSTQRMPLWELLVNGQLKPVSLDECFEQSEDFDELSRKIYSELQKRSGTVCYVVYGSGLDNQSAAYALRQAKRDKVKTGILPGVALADTAAAAWKCTGHKRVLTATDALNTAMNVREVCVITEIDNKLLAGDLKCKLLEQYRGEQKAEYYIENERGEGRATELELADLDRMEPFMYNQTASLLLRSVPLLEVQKYDFTHLLEIMCTLRGINGCPWDREQDHKSLERYLIEEAYEAVEAIRQDDTDMLYDELGDVLLQVVFHAQVGSEHGEFDITDVTDAVCRKMITRHPHIFADTQVNNSDDVLRNWEVIKHKEKNMSTYAQVMEDVPKSIPALMRAYKIGQKAKQVSFDWPDAQEALQKVEEELAEFKSALANHNTDNADEELGDLLFSMVNTARLAGIQPEIALNRAVDKFVRRFTVMEDKIGKSGYNIQEMQLNDMNAYWKMVKNEET